MLDNNLFHSKVINLKHIHIILWGGDIMKFGLITGMAVGAIAAMAVLADVKAMKFMKKAKNKVDDMMN